MKLAKLAAGAAAALAFSTANGAVIDFQNLPSGRCMFLGNGTVQSGGFDFRGNPADPAMYACDDGALQRNPTRALLNANQRSIVTMTPASGGVFSLDSFFAGGRAEDFEIDQPVTRYAVAEGIEVRGNLAGGGSVVTTFKLDTVAPYAWQQFFLPEEFTALSSVVFSALGNRNPEFLIDAIAVNTRIAAAVSEPGSCALLGVAALVAGGLRQARRARPHRESPAR
jgi:hypothetical protein